MEIIRGVVKKSIFIILPAAAVSAFFEWKRLPLSIVIGWVFGLLNLRSLAKNVKGFIGSEKTPAKIVFFSITRLFALFAAIALLIYFKIINALGLLFGFTVVFVFILIEGMKAAKST